MIPLKQHRVPDAVAGTRLVDYVADVFSEHFTRSSVKKAIKRGEILVNDEKADQGQWVKPGNIILWVNLEHNPPKIFELKLPVVFEDDHLAVINKPAGFAISGNKYKTIANALPFNLGISAQHDALKRPMPVHRLDYPTSGLLLAAKTRASLVYLGHQFEERLVSKTYLAIVAGQAPAEGLISHPLDGQEAITSYRLIKSIASLKVNAISLLELKPQTGRTHQLRRHLADTGYPIVGDSKYGKPAPLLKGKGLFLCATGLEFTHPGTKKKCVFRIDPPLKFSALMEREYRRWKKYNP